MSSGGKTPGVSQIGQENPEIVSENVKPTRAAFSSATKPGNKDQTETPAETETTDYGQTETNRS